MLRCALSCAFLLQALFGQIPRIPEVPGGLWPCDAKVLATQRSQLVREREALRAAITAFNGLPPVPAGSTEARNRRSESVRLEAEKEAHITAIREFERVIEQARSRAPSQAVIDATRPAHLHQMLDDAKRSLGTATSEDARARANQRIRLVERALANLPAAPHPNEGVMWRLGQFFGLQYDEQIEKERGFVADKEQEDRLNAILLRLKQRSVRPDQPLEVKILAGSEISVVALATQTCVYVEKSYLDLKPTDDELLFVIGHELAHSQLGHGARKVVTHLEQRLLESIQGAEAGDARVDAAIHAAAINARMSGPVQELEQEADLVGAQIAIAAGADVRGLRDLIHRMERWESEEHADRVARGVGDAAHEALRKLIASHPAASRRRAYLEESIGTKL
ncbi:MAG: M48 family metalloprotease [Planctomycetota bacterium]|nr:M48 family metalloprotease [Planctomycetota bacterium]